MKDEQNVTVYDMILAAFFHDIGKVGQRTGKDEPMDPHYEGRCPTNLQGGYSFNKHVKWTERFLDDYELKFKEKKHSEWQLIKNLAASHHKESTFEPKDQEHLIKILIEADHIASSWDRDAELDKSGYNQMYTKPLYSIFNSLKQKESGNESWYLPLTGNSVVDKWFPVKEVEELSLKEDYSILFDNFKNDFLYLTQLSNKGNIDIVQFTDAVESLLEKYFWNVPATIMEKIPTNSLYHHLKTTALISSLLFQAHQKDVDAISNKDDASFIMIGGDLNGIQDYLYDLNPEHSAMVAKFLRSRSAKIKLMNEMAIHLIIERCGLTRQNILFNVGGKFALLAVDTEEIRETLKEIKELVEKEFLNTFQGRLSLNLNYETKLSLSDLGQEKFSHTLGAFFTNLDQSKKKRFINVLQEQDGWNTENFVLKDDFITSNQERCFYCQRRIHRSDIIIKDKDKEIISENICEYCYKEYKLGMELPKYDAYSFYKEKDKDKDKEIDEIYLQIGEIALKQATKALQNPDLDPGVYYFKIKDDERSPHLPFKPIASYVPLSENDKRSTMTFEDIAKESKGIDYCAVLKGDVDNLGRVFEKDVLKKIGGREVLSITTYNTLSAQIDLFFSNYLPSLIAKDDKYRNIYIVYAGGDDFCIIGPWSTIVEFAYELAEDFKKFTLGNLTFSVGIELMRKKSPIKNAIAFSEESLERAKQRENKNGLTLFETVLGWDEYSEQLELGKEIAEWISRRDIDATDQTNNNQFIRRLLTYYDMYEQTKLETCPAFNYLYTSYISYDIERNYRNSKKHLPISLDNYLKGIIEISDKKKTLDNFKVALTYAIYYNRKPKNQESAN